MICQHVVSVLLNHNFACCPVIGHVRVFSKGNPGYEGSTDALSSGAGGKRRGFSPGSAARLLEWTRGMRNEARGECHGQGGPRGFPRLWYDPYPLRVRGPGLCPFLVRWSVICCQDGRLMAFAKDALPEEYLSHNF